MARCKPHHLLGRRLQHTGLRGGIHQAEVVVGKGHVELARLDAGAMERMGAAPQPDGADRVFVDRIMMVHVELHLRDDTAEIGHETAEHARFVHPAKHGFGIAFAG